MGVESRKGPPLPAPTESDSNTGTGREASELESRVTEKTTYSLASDGSPVTIATKNRDKSHGLGSNKSQTSLLIEYFEGGKEGKSDSRRPSVRVKVTPSSKSRSRSANDHIQITERKGTRKPSYTKRIQLSENSSGDKLAEGEGEGEGDNHSLHSYRSATEESNVTSRGGRPIEVEIMPRRHGSPLIPTGEGSSKYIQNASDISSMPADSFLDGKTRSPERKRSQSLSRGELLAGGAAAGLAAGAVADQLKTPSRRRSRSLSRERVVAQKAVEKVRAEKSERRRKHRSRSRSVSGEHSKEGVKSPRRRSSRTHAEDSMLSGADSSLLNSKLSGKSGDQYSFRSGTSKSSINNPKLLETVEDAIRRLILPELTALKKSQSKRDQRDRHRRGSVTSGSGVSRDSVEDSYHGSSTDLSNKPRVTLNDEELSRNSPKSRKDKNKNIDRIKLEESPRSFEREASEETVVQDGERVRRKRSSDGHRGFQTAAIGAGAAAGAAALTAAALHKHQSQDELDEKKERRRRRAKSRSRSDIMSEDYEERERETIPPMPLMSDINPSDITRSSILSAETERPHSASQEHRVTPVREVTRGIGSPASNTPTKVPALSRGLGTQHSNYSRGDLSLHSPPSEEQLHGQEYELDEHGRKVPMYDEDDDSYLEYEQERDQHQAPNSGFAGAAAGAGMAAMHHDYSQHEDSELMEDEDPYYYQNHQEVPPPLRYVPYGHQRRGLSPIPSVSGYTEGDPEQTRDSRLTQSTGSMSSLGKAALHKQSRRSMKSLDMSGSAHGNEYDFSEVRHGGLADSELTQDGDYWEEQHRENDRNRDLDAESYRSSDPQVDYKRMTNYTTDSMDAPDSDRVTAGQNVHGVGAGANPDYVHTPIAVESAVASLVNASDVTAGSGNLDRRASNVSFEDGSERHFTSRGNSPAKRDTFGGMKTSKQQNSPSKYMDEYDIDEQGRKVALPKYQDSHGIEEAALVGIASGAAAHYLKGRNRQSDADQIEYESRNEDTGAPLHKSFKERAFESQGQIPQPLSVRGSDAGSFEQLKMGASGIPDLHDPMPEIGYVDGESEVDTNPSIIQGPIGEAPEEQREPWPRHLTPTRKPVPSRSLEHDANRKAAEAALIGGAAGAAAAAAGHARDLSHDTNDDEWQRSSGDRKRDTLVTNPYEGTSPLAANAGRLDRELMNQAAGLQGLDHDFAGTKLGYGTGSPLPKDEGYISSAPVAGAISPEPKLKGVDFREQAVVEGGLDSDPFYTPKHVRQLSGMSHGMESPLYDSATGNHIDRIQSKDIVALMDHLTVRDAQRSARDTEILVTLVRAAAEMRNSFEDMKRLLADTEDQIITEVQGNTERTVQKAINGPRPQPQSVARSTLQNSASDMYEDIPAKKRNVFRRALKGLSMKSTNDLGKIEDMLVQLLGEVEGLKGAQGLNHSSSQRANSFVDMQQEGNYENDHGYEPEGNAGTSTASHASHSGHLSIPLRGASGARGLDNRKFSDHRISTVPEGDEEELEPHEQAVLDNFPDNDTRLLTPTRETIRADSAPLGTPPLQNVAPASLSNENTPRTDKSKKHKSSNSNSWIPKVSRWSDTTASTIFKGLRSSGRNSGRKDSQYADPPSRSGSDMGNYNDEEEYAAERDYYPQEEENLPPPRSLLPPEDPKYKAHRNSLNLQHPQPRPGPTHRYQTALESQAVNFDTPMTPASANWSQTSLHRLPQQNTNRYSDTTNNTGTGRMSPHSDAAYTNNSASNQAPPRPPKEPLAPQFSPNIRTGKLQKPSPLQNEHLSPDRPYSASGAAYERSGSPRSAPRSASGTLGGVPARKPTGPRSMSTASRSGELRDEGSVRRNKNRDTFGTIASNLSDESETF